MVSPKGAFPLGLSCDSAEEPVSRILSRALADPCAVIPLGAASPRTLISDLPGGFGNGSSRLGASGRRAARAWLLAPASLPIWSCSVWGLPCPGSYETSGALLPHHFTLTGGLAVQACALQADPLLRLALRLAATPAVSFLWHWPSARLQANIPDVIRHTALRSSDFPPPEDSACAFPRQRPPGPPASL